MNRRDREPPGRSPAHHERGSAVASILVAALLGCSPETWRAASSGPAAASLLHGAWDCRPEEPDCNPCAADVRGQLDTDRWQEGDSDWQFVPSQRYRGVTPDEAYHGSLLDHVQGFVRLNGAGVRFAMVHSGGRRYSGKHFASLSLIEERAGELWLGDLHSIDAVAAHTSGLFTLGRYVGMFSADGVLTMQDVSRDLSTEQVDYALPIPHPRAHGISSRSGGVAMLRLAEGGYLLLANEGGDGSSSGHSHFYRVQNAFLRVAAAVRSRSLVVSDLGDWQYPHAHGGPADYHHSENLSLISECGTGDIYAVYVGSSRSVIKALGPLGRTFWRVARVVISPEQVALEPIGVFTRVSSLERCFGRAAGSAFVREDHRLDFLCHERAHVRGHPPTWHFWSHLASLPAPPSSEPANSPARSSADPALQAPP